MPPVIIPKTNQAGSAKALPFFAKKKGVIAASLPLEKQIKVLRYKLNSENL
jgi:hypothetical protein